MPNFIEVKQSGYEQPVMLNMDQVVSITPQLVATASDGLYYRLDEATYAHITETWPCQRITKSKS